MRVCRIFLFITPYVLQKMRALKMLFITQIAQPRIVPPAAKIIQITAISVGLALKADIEISLIEIAILKQAHQPLDEIYNIKRHKQQLTLLSIVDTLVIHDISVYPRRVPYPISAKQIHTVSLRHQA